MSTRIKPKHWWSGLGCTVCFAAGIGAVLVAGAIADAPHDVKAWVKRRLRRSGERP